MKKNLLISLCCLLLLCLSTARADWLTVDASRVLAEVKPQGEGLVTARLAVQEAGDYYLALKYRPLTAYAFDTVVKVTAGNTVMHSQLPLLWRDQEAPKAYDRLGNEIPPVQRLADETCLSFFEDYSSYERVPFLFHFEKGEQDVLLEVIGARLNIQSVLLVKPEAPQSYAAYRAAHGATELGSGLITIQAEAYTLKSDSFLRGDYVNNLSLTPYDATARRINALSDKAFKTPGQKVMYSFEITSGGLYALAFKYTQPVKAGMPVFRTVQIDGQVLFDELKDMPFPFTGINRFDNAVLGGADPYYIYLAPGTHTLAVKVTAAPLDSVIKRVNAMISEMNATTLKIKKLLGKTGDDAAQVDLNRTWNVLDYLPTILTDLERWETELDGLYARLYEISGQEPTFAADLALAAGNLRKLREDPRTIPNRAGLLGDDASSAAQLLGTLLPKLSEQNLGLDCIYLFDGTAQLPDPSAPFISGLKDGAEKFLHSFSPEMNRAISRKKDGPLSVWVHRPAQYVEALNNLCAATFTKETGIEVVFSALPKEDKLVLSNASGTNPDVVVSASAQYPFDFGVRGLAKNLLEYDGFLQWYEKEYNLEGLVQYSYDGGVYAATDTQNFRVLFYRKDILEDLGLQVPQTMDDVRAMLPTLLRNAMNFSLPLSTDREGFKGFQQTMPFVYQRGGDIYAPDGLSALLLDPKTVQGFQEMCDLYRVYGCLTNVKSFFNSFRSGAVPLGISDVATYFQLQTAAPELSGLWDIALAPGVKDAQGNILRYQAASDSATMILSNTEKPDEAYAFLCWWLKKETQVEYANEMQRLYGPEYKWNTANLEAFKEMGFPDKHKEVILTMWRDWQKETPRHVASYMLERELSNLWSYVVKEEQPFMGVLDQAQKSINREMTRKLSEFGFVDEKGNPHKPYHITTAEDLRQLSKKEAAQ